MCNCMYPLAQGPVKKGCQLALDAAWEEEKEGDTQRKVKGRKLEIRLERIAHQTHKPN